MPCAKGVQLRDNYFNIGGYAFGMGSGKWTGRINSRLKPPQRSAKRNISLSRGFQIGHYTYRP
jgi:hypothetical protein